MPMAQYRRVSVQQNLEFGMLAEAYATNKAFTSKIVALEPIKL
jgi:hypothetical protein